MVGLEIDFDHWKRDCPYRSGSQCVWKKNWCRKYSCPRIQVYKKWRRIKKGIE